MYIFIFDKILEVSGLMDGYESSFKGCFLDKQNPVDRGCKTFSKKLKFENASLQKIKRPCIEALLNYRILE